MKKQELRATTVADAHAAFRKTLIQYFKERLDTIADSELPAFSEGLESFFAKRASSTTTPASGGNPPDAS